MLLEMCFVGMQLVLNSLGIRTKQKGQGLVEYALILVLVAIVVIAIQLQLGPQIGNIFSRITSGLLAAG